MFSKALTDLQLASAAAAEFFPKIVGESFEGDGSFLATLRALLCDRLPEDYKGTISLFFKSSSFRKDVVDGASNRDVIHTIADAPCPGNIVVHSLCGSADDNAAVFAKYDDPEHGFLAMYPSFHEVAAVRDYCKLRIIETRVYVNPETDACLLLFERLDMRRYHFIESAIPQFLPRLFADKPIDVEKEVPLLAALIDRSSADYERLIDEFAGRFDFRSAVIRKEIAGFERKARKRELDAIAREITSINDDISRLMARFSELMERRDERNIRLMGLRCAADQAGEGSELMDYLLCNKNIELLSAEDGRLEFYVRGWLDSYDPDMFAAMIDKAGSLLNNGYDKSDAFSNVRTRKRLLKAIFGADPVLKIRTCGYFYLSISGDVGTQSGRRFPSKYGDCIPNPHLWHFSCFGGHEPAIADMLSSGNMAGAVMQCVSSAHSINVGEEPTMHRFLSELFTTNKKCIELPDGSNVSPADAVAWLKKAH